LERVYQYIDGYVDEHVRKLQEFLRQPSISQTGEGVTEYAELLKKYLLYLGCQSAELVNEGYLSPIVFGKYNAGAEKSYATILYNFATSK